MVTAYILIQTEVGKAAQVAKEISEIKGVQQAEDVTGPRSSTSDRIAFPQAERVPDEPVQLLFERRLGVSAVDQLACQPDELPDSGVAPVRQGEGLHVLGHEPPPAGVEPVAADGVVVGHREPRISDRQ